MKGIDAPVFYHHAVLPETPKGWKLHPDLITLIDIFEDQLLFIRENRYESLFLEEWMVYRKRQKRSTGKTICITLDDGLLDSWVYAFPLAKRHRVRITLFVIPECVDPRSIVRPTLEDVWAGNCYLGELQNLGYVSWAELRIMQESGWVDVQSHTMTHLKYIASSRIEGFYYGGVNGIYPILVAHPELKPYYMTYPNFEKLLHFGAPLFMEKSAVITRRHYPNPALLTELAELADQYDLSNLSERTYYEQKAMTFLRNYEANNQVITDIESEEEFGRRLSYEINESKHILEEKLGKPVRFLCWPHGDNSEKAHAIAKSGGYMATTSGKLRYTADHPDRIPRLGSGFQNNRWIGRQKFIYRIAAHFHQEPYYSLFKLNQIRWQILSQINTNHEKDKVSLVEK